MTHDEMIKNLEVGMTLQADGQKDQKIVKIEKKYSNANNFECDHYMSTITIDSGQSIGSKVLHDLVCVKNVIVIVGL